MHKRCIKRSFTLLEILLVISLIATGLGVLSLQISKALKKEKFEQGVEQLISKLTLAQGLMLDFQTNVRVKLFQETVEVVCTIETDKTLPPHLERSINRYHKIPAILEMQLDRSVQEEIILNYDASLGITTQGVLTLISGPNEEQIHLKGYPTRVKRGANEKNNECHVPYPEEILSTL